MVQITKELYNKCLLTPTGGKHQRPREEKPDEIWITPSAIFKGDLHPDMMVRIDLQACTRMIHLTRLPVSAKVHCAIYRTRPDITAVIHTHAPQATLMASRDQIPSHLAGVSLYW